MFRTRIINIKDNGSEAAEYFDAVTSESRAMRNTANFFIRNCMTALKKDTADRTDLETKVLETISRGISIANKNAEERLARKVKKISDSDLSDEEKAEAVEKEKKKTCFFTMPTAKKWMLSYGLLDAVYKCTENAVYRAMPAQANQKAIRYTCESWRSYFAAHADWKVHPQKYQGEPKIPGYIRNRRATAFFSSQNSRISIHEERAFLSFSGTKMQMTVGKETDFTGLDYVKCEVIPKHGYFKVCVTFEDDAETIEVPEHPKRIMGVDVGLHNLAACCTNTGSTPFVISGGFARSANQYFNKRKACLTGILTRGYDSSHSRKTSRALSALSRKRGFFFRDAFYKIAWRICRYAEKENIDVIVIGHNEGQKQEANMGAQNNQNFVSIPYTALIQAVKIVAQKCGIAVVVREESYTSKASLLDGDDIPTYQKGSQKGYTFSGKRAKRGLYISSDGTKINADINGAGNILRKEYPYAFEGQDLSYLWKSCSCIGFRDLYANAPKKPHTGVHRKSRCGKGTRYRHNMRQARRTAYKKCFGWTKAKTQQKAA